MRVKLSTIGGRADTETGGTGSAARPSLVAMLKDHVGPVRSSFSADLMASIVVFLIAMPLSMGIAIASGVPPALGIVGAIVGGLVVSLIAGAPLLVSGPAAGLAVLIWELVRDHGLLALGPVVLVAGLIQIAAGGFGMGLWFRAVSPAVIHGMLAGIGVSIVANQLYIMMDGSPLGNGLKNLMIFPGELERLGEAVMSVPASQWLQPINGSASHLAVGIGILSMVLALLWGKIAPERLRLLPAPLVAVVATSALAWVLALPVKYVSVPPNLLDAVSFISPAGFGEIFHGPLFTAALAIAFIASAETLLSAAAVDKMHSGPRTKYDQELIAQGIGNSLCGILGTLPMTGVIARSGVNVTAGAKTRTSAFLHGVWLLVFAGVFSGLLERIPLAALAGILVVVGIKLIDPGHIRHLSKYGRGEVFVYWLTLATIVATDLLDGVLMGIGFAFAKLLYSLLHLDIAIAIDHKEKRAALKLHGAATFIQLPNLAKALEKVPLSYELHANIHDLNYIDHACLELLETWEEEHKATGGRLIVEWEALSGRLRRQRTVHAAVPATVERPASIS
ncbi:MAG: SulP family inorganic anion transporter [Rhodospirillales bacterium]|nr:SulP family inorganic anion transporter [Rhodospirillales bacterium]